MIDAHALIDYARAELRDAPRAGRFQRETFVPVACPSCGDERWLRLFDAARMVRRYATHPDRVPVCEPCHCRTIAGKGYAAAIARHPRFRLSLIERVRQYRLDHPSALETIVERAFLDLCISHSRETLLATKTRGRRQRWYLLDFTAWLPCGTQVAIEVDGRFAHALPDARDRDRRKSALCKRRGIRLVRIPEDDVRVGRVPALLSQLFNSEELSHA